MAVAKFLLADAQHEADHQSSNEQDLNEQKKTNPKVRFFYI